MKDLEGGKKEGSMVEGEEEGRERVALVQV